MDNRRFDDWARQIASGGTRRTALRGLAGLASALAVSRLGKSDATARRGSSGSGDPCRHNDQCSDDLVCAWNGYGHDGDWNCCNYERGWCWDDSGCCGLSQCFDRSCGPDNSGGTSVSGSGGVATSSAQGGTIVTGDIDSGGNVGNVSGVGNTAGNVAVDGGYVSNTTDVSVTTDGGTAIADASGGSGNVAGGGGYYDANGNWVPSGGYQTGQDVDPNCYGPYGIQNYCPCWQGPYDDNPCDGAMVCCRPSGTSSGTCMSYPDCTGWYGPGERCPGYCDWGSGCPSCTTGYCNWSGYCDGD